MPVAGSRTPHARPRLWMVSMQELDLSQLVERCAEESSHFARGQDHDDRYCLEVFRRAIVERDTVAWDAIHRQYHALVRSWIGQHALASTVEDHEDMVARVFERFWQAVQPAKFAAFPHLSSLLRYLKMCVFAAIVDEARAQRTWEGHRAAGELADEVEGERVDEMVLDALGRTALWEAIETALPDQAERLVVYLSCVIGLKPREIARRHAHVFPSVEEVYQRKRLALERLRRDTSIRAFWEGRA
jgi:RNA polymerase sigma factor (sigma-70 family)